MNKAHKVELTDEEISAKKKIAASRARQHRKERSDRGNRGRKSGRYVSEKIYWE